MSAPVRARERRSALTFRDKLSDNLPSWLKGPVGARWVYPWGVALDAMADAATWGVLCGYATQCPPDALPWIAVDRQIDRGFAEPEESYRARCRLWLDLWRRSGSAESIIVALGATILPDTTTMRTVSNDSAWDTITGGAAPPPHHTLARPRNWDWDSLVPGHITAPSPDEPGYASQWWRAWVIIYAPPSWAQGRIAGDGARAGDGHVAGLSISHDYVQTIRAQVRKWAPAHVMIPSILISFDESILSPSATYPSSGALPDGRFRWYGYRYGGGDIYLPVRAILGVGYSGAHAVRYLAGIGHERYGL